MEDPVAGLSPGDYMLAAMYYAGRGLNKRRLFLALRVFAIMEALEKLFLPCSAEQELLELELNRLRLDGLAARNLKLTSAGRSRAQRVVQLLESTAPATAALLRRLVKAPESFLEQVIEYRCGRR